MEVAGWVLAASAILAWYVATAMMLAATPGRTILPLGTLEHAGNVPTNRPMRPIELTGEEPGVKMRQ